MADDTPSAFRDEIEDYRRRQRQRDSDGSSSSSPSDAVASRVGGGTISQDEAIAQSDLNYSPALTSSGGSSGGGSRRRSSGGSRRRSSGGSSGGGSSGSSEPVASRVGGGTINEAEAVAQSDVKPASVEQPSRARSRQRDRDRQQTAALQAQRVRQSEVVHFEGGEVQPAPRTTREEVAESFRRGVGPEGQTPAEAVAEYLGNRGRQTEGVASALYSIGEVGVAAASQLNPLVFGRSLKAAGEYAKDFVSAPAQNIQELRQSALIALQDNPSRALGIVAGEALVAFGVGKVGSRLTRSSTRASTSVQSTTKGVKRTVTAADDLSLSTTEAQTIIETDRGDTFRADTRSVGVQRRTGEDASVSQTRTVGDLERLGREGEVLDVRELQAETIEELVSTGGRTTGRAGTRVNVDGRILDVESAGVGAQVAEGSTVSGRVSRARGGSPDRVTFGASDELVRAQQGDLEFSESLIRSETLGGTKADQFRDAVAVELDRVDQARGNRPTGGDSGGGRGGGQEAVTQTQDASFIEQSLEEAVVDVVSQEAGQRAGRGAAGGAAAPVPDNQRPAPTAPASVTETHDSLSVSFEDVPSQRPRQRDEVLLTPTMTPLEETLTGSGSDTDQGTGTGTRGGTEQTQDQRPGRRQDQPQDQQPIQIIEQDQRVATPQLPRQRQQQRLAEQARQRRAEEARTRPVRPLALPIPAVGKSGGARFRVIVGRKGNKIYRDLGVGGADLVRRARSLVKSTPAASLRVEPVDGSASAEELSSLLGKDFRRSKTQPFSFVQRREDRISSAGEKAGITDLGIAASRKKGGSKNLLSAGKGVFDKALELSGKGVPLKKIREWL